MELFTKIQEPNFEKYASSMTKLSPNIEDWSAEITNEAYKQLPFISGKEVIVELQKVNQENKSGIGVIKLVSEQKQGGKPVKKQIIFPLIVKEGHMFPLDVMFLDGRMVPATKRDVNKYFFNPSIFVSREKDPGKKKMHPGLFPFSTSSGLPLGSNTRTTKVAHVEEDHFKEAEEKINSNEFLKQYLDLEGIDTYKEDNEKTAEIEAPSSLDAILIRKDKTAYGMTRDPFGIYKYKNINTEKLAENLLEDGEDMMIGEGEGLKDLESLDVSSGVVNIPNVGKGIYFDTLMDIDGKLMDNKMFISDQVYSIQEKIAGEQVSKEVNRENEVNGKGIFYFHDGEKYAATYPLLVLSKVDDLYLAKTTTGEPVKLAYSENVKVPVNVEDDLYVIPKNSKFIKLPKKFNKVPEYSPEDINESGRVTLSKTSEGFYLDGPPMNDVKLDKVPEKLASLVIVGLGGTPDQVDSIIKTAEVRGQTKFYTNKELIDYNTHRMDKFSEEFQKLISNSRKDLLEEAAVIKKYASKEEEKLVDELVGLNFVNNRNIITFIEKLPDIQKTGEDLAGMLLASRLGLSGVPEDAVISSIENLTDVISSLQTIKENYMSPKPDSGESE